MKRWAIFLPLLACACASPEKKATELYGPPASIVVEGWAKPEAGREKALSDARREAVSTALRTHLSSEVLNTKARELDPMLADPAKYIAADKVLSEGQEGGFYKLRLEASVLFGRVGADLRSAGLLRGPTEQLDRVGILIEGPPESVDAVSKALGSLNVPVLYSSTGSFIENGEPRFVLASAEARRRGARLLIAGQSSSSAGTLGAWNADVRLWLVDPQRADKLAQGMGRGTAGGDSSEIAAGKAFTSAAETAISAIQPVLQRRLAGLRSVTVTVKGIGSPNDVRGFLDHLRAQDAVEGTALQVYNQGHMIATVWIRDKSADDLAALILRNPSYSLEIRSVGPDELEFERR